MIQELIHKNIVDRCEKVGAWFENKGRDLSFPIYSSYDIRDSGYKVAPVDANIFPAGFNNICHVDKENAPQIMRAYLQAHYADVRADGVGLLTEEHTGNLFYWENVATLRDILKQAGYDVVVFVPSQLSDVKKILTPKNQSVDIYGTENIEGEIFVKHKKLELIICNNDFSVLPAGWPAVLRTQINPPPQLGWYNRRKHLFFEQYNLLAKEFAELIEITPGLLQIKTELFANFDVNDPDSLESLATKVDQFIDDLKLNNLSLGVEQAPFCFIKNNMGTYGMGVMQAHSGDDVRKWNSKMRAKMKSTKGGQKITSVILQEGIPTRFKDESGATAEPCIYLIGNELVGGFLRTHAEKSGEENLNSPGAIFKRLCVSDLEVNLPGCPMENVYGWTSKLSALALALEAKQAGVKI